LNDIDTFLPVQNFISRKYSFKPTFFQGWVPL